MIIKSINSFSQKTFRNKKILSIDFGERKLGFAHSDYNQIIATPLKTLYSKGIEEDLIAINNILISIDSNVILFGLPLELDGSFGRSSQKVKSFADIVDKKYDVSIFFWDERYTSKQAQDSMFALNKKTDTTNREDDQLAASITLQAFLDYYNHRS